MTASLRSLGSLPCSQQQTRSLWSLLCNAGPLSFQSSGRILLTPAALPLLNCSMVLVISFPEDSSSNSALKGCWGMQRTTGSWMTWSVLKKDWRCSDQRLRMEALSVKSPYPSALPWGLCRSLCSHLGQHISEFSLQDWSTTHFRPLEACTGGCCKWDEKQPSSQDMTA